jgi:ketosteroid isomerase-like protein
MHRVTLAALSALAVLVTSALPGQAARAAALTRQVFAAESSFAATLANRDTAAFAALVSPEAVFFGEKTVMRGKAAVVDGWRPLFAGPTAPFSWRPDVVEVLPSGTLALSSGPVHDPGGKQIGTFSSVWRREPDGTWRVIFDKGCPVCNCERGP